MQFYADENFPLAAVIELRRLGHDVLTAFEDGRANKSIEDSKVLARSAKLKRVILTINRLDFKRLHNSGTHIAEYLFALLMPISSAWQQGFTLVVMTKMIIQENS